MFKRPTIIILSLVAVTLLFSASAFVWQTVNASSEESVTIHSKVNPSWDQDSKSVDLDSYIEANQIDQDMIDKKQRLILKPELVHFHGVLQAPIASAQADLVADTLGVWGITPLPEVAFSTYIRTPQGQVIAVYVENTVASHISSNYPVETVLEFQAYRLYNYAKGPRLLLVGLRPTEERIAKAVKATRTL